MYCLDVLEILLTLKTPKKTLTVCQNYFFCHWNVQSIALQCDLIISEVQGANCTFTYDLHFFLVFFHFPMQGLDLRHN
ncbi:hypothetical protein XELAEV_18047817mg [Xenopus laevis]|uniref:Uncharacterized protein n=1 Tax=Xenopus laevis TaxID=8355 RepID=A0A974H1W8_XENLA|nr:hypothetical protein XELAEV_18047817mg [Xenopus laevis]